MDTFSQLAAGADTGELWRSVYPPLFRFVSRQTGASRAEVEDIVSETILQGWRDRDRFRGEASTLTWLMSIARHRIIEFRRKQEVRKRSGEVLQAIACLESQIVAEDILQETEMIRRVRVTLDALPEQFSTLLTRIHCEGKTVRAIALELGETEDAVESRLRRARQAFKEHLKSKEAHDESL